jgi:CheY-like chemotaxis protein
LEPAVGCVRFRGDQGAEQPDLLIVDLHLDWYEAGWDLLNLLRHEPATAALPVIVCSADVPRLRLRERQLVAWQCHILARPFSTEQLLTAVQTALAGALLQPGRRGMTGRSARAWERSDLPLIG